MKIPYRLLHIFFFCTATLAAIDVVEVVDDNVGRSRAHEKSIIYLGWLSDTEFVSVGQEGAIKCWRLGT